MTSKAIFCNSPWYELHIYWDGGLGICCQETQRLYSQGDYNIANTKISDWYNSEPVREFRLALLGNTRTPVCRRCYIDEDLGGNSRRIKSLQKSVIFARQAFGDSYSQSPGFAHFEHSKNTQGWADTQPVDLHVDLGNYCNLACKMCNPRASSVIASQHVQWGIESDRQYLRHDWTRNPQVWQSFVEQVLAIPTLKNIHFMGGETLLTNRIENLVDQFSAAGRFDVSFSFVTNGTVYDPELMAKLTKFRRVGIEISIETISEHNAYVRQGTDTKQVLNNIDLYLTWCNNSNITVTLRPAPSVLTVGYYHTLLEYALSRQLIVKSNVCFNPPYMHAAILPDTVKQQYVQPYERLLAQLPTASDQDYNASDPHNYRSVIAEQATLIKNLLLMPEPPGAESLRAELVQHCKKWDQVYGYNARELYPELESMWDQHGY